MIPGYFFTVYESNACTFITKPIYFFIMSAFSVNLVQMLFFSIPELNNIIKIMKNCSSLLQVIFINFLFIVIFNCIGDKVFAVICSEG